MSSFPSLEIHPLRVSKSTDMVSTRKVIIGPPDIYPQDAKQKEDQLVESNVREGYNYTKPIMEEYDSARNYPNDFVNYAEQNDYLNGLLAKFHFNSIKQDTTKRKQMSPNNCKDLTFCPVVEKNKELTREWMTNLAKSMPYSELLSKRIPYVHKKEEVLKELIRYEVPITSAVWFIKVTAALTSIQAESNKKRTRSNVDNSTDWTQSFKTLMREKFDLVMLNLMNAVSEHDYEIGCNEFDYLMRLMTSMFDNELLDHTEMFNWLTDRFECTIDNAQKMKFFLPFIMQFCARFSKSEITTRKILYYAKCAFNNLVGNDMPGILNEYGNCSLHRTIILQLSGLIASLALQMPSSLVWNDIKEPDDPLHGSPMDNFGCPLSSLPLILGADNAIYREHLQNIEQFVVMRSELAELRWNVYDQQQQSNHYTNKALVQMIELVYELDHFDYSVYQKDFTLTELCGKLHEICSNNIQLLIYIVLQWAVNPSRTGNYRALVGVNLLEEFVQNNMLSSQEQMQQILTGFLDNGAPFIDLNGTTTIDSEPFRNLVSLFGELIDRELFSPNQYINFMISHGLFDNTKLLPLPCLVCPVSNTSTSITMNYQSPDAAKTPIENPDSNRSDQSLAIAAHHSQQSQIDYKQLPRHIQYLLHFPIPQNDDYLHEQNLRFQKLYQSSRSRTAHDTYLKKLVKDIIKLITRRARSIDLIQAQLNSKTQRNQDEFHQDLDRNIEVILSRFKSLTYYDMECVLTQLLPQLLIILSPQSLYSTNEKYRDNNLFVPHPKSINMVLVMMELSTNYTQLVQFIARINKHFDGLTEIFKEKRHGNGACLPRLYSYTSQYRFYIFGMLIKYHCILMLLPVDTRMTIFDTIWNLSRSQHPVYQHINLNTFSFVFNMIQSCCIIREKNQHPQLVRKFEMNFQKIKPDINRQPDIEYLEHCTIDKIHNPPHPFNIQGEFICEIRSELNQTVSFIVNCIKHLTKPHDPDHLYKLRMFFVNHVCLTEWIFALLSLLMPFNCMSGYKQFDTLFQQLIQTLDTNFFDNISLLIATYITKNNYSFCTFLRLVLNRALAVNLCPSDFNHSYTCTTRFACYILHKLFTMDFPMGSDLHYLSYSLQKVHTETMVDLLKMLSVHSDLNRVNESNLTDPFELENPNLLTLRINNLTLRVLREICALDWVRMKFINKKPSDLIRDNVLIDTNTSKNQSRNLMNIICNPRGHSLRVNSPSNNNAQENWENIYGIISDLNLWNIHMELMRVQYLLTQCTDEEQHDTIEMTAKGVVTLFHQRAEALYRDNADDNDFYAEFNGTDIYLDDELEYTNTSTNTSTNNNNSINNSISNIHSIINLDATYFIPYLIQKLPFELFKKFICISTCEKLELAKQFSTHKNSQDKEKDLVKSMVLLAYSSFVDLLKPCLSLDTKTDFLKSLYEQIESFVTNAKETERVQPDDFKVKQLIYRSLRLKLAFVGMMFDRILDNVDLFGDWIVLLAKLVIYAVVEPLSNSGPELFFTVLDMFMTLVHRYYVNNTMTQRAQAGFKRLRKELADRANYDTVELLKPYLPNYHANKASYEVVVTSPLQLFPNKLPSNALQRAICNAEKSGKEGCVVQRKERIIGWEVIEGIQGLFPLSWFSAVTTWDDVLPIELQANLMIGHTHRDAVKRSDAYYLSAPDYPIEDNVGQDNTNISTAGCVTGPGGSSSICSGSNPPSVVNPGSVSATSIGGGGGPAGQMDVNMKSQAEIMMLPQTPGQSIGGQSLVSGANVGGLIRSHSNASTASSTNTIAIGNNNSSSSNGPSSTKRVKRSNKRSNNSNSSGNNNSSSNNTGNMNSTVSNAVGVSSLLGSATNNIQLSSNPMMMSHASHQMMQSAGGMPQQQIRAANINQQLQHQSMSMHHHQQQQQYLAMQQQQQQQQQQMMMYNNSNPGNSSATPAGTNPMQHHQFSSNIGPPPPPPQYLDYNPPHKIRSQQVIQQQPPPTRSGLQLQPRASSQNINSSSSTGGGTGGPTNPAVVETLKTKLLQQQRQHPNQQQQQQDMGLPPPPYPTASSIPPNTATGTTGNSGPTRMGQMTQIGLNQNSGLTQKQQPPPLTDYNDRQFATESMYQQQQQVYHMQQRQMHNNQMPVNPSVVVNSQQSQSLPSSSAASGGSMHHAFPNEAQAYHQQYPFPQQQQQQQQQQQRMTLLQHQQQQQVYNTMYNNQNNPDNRYN